MPRSTDAVRTIDLRPRGAPISAAVCRIRRLYVNGELLQPRCELETALAAAARLTRRTTCAIGGDRKRTCRHGGRGHDGVWVTDAPTVPASVARGLHP